jgi:hypothetical protein
VTVAVTGNVSADALVKRLRRSGKNAEQWPEQQQPADSTQTAGENNKQATEPDRPGDTRTAEMPASTDAETSIAEQSNSKTSAEAEDPSKTSGKTATPAHDGTASIRADADGAVDHATKEATAEQCSDPKRTRKGQQPEEEKPVDTMVVVTAASAESSHACHLPSPVQQEPPVHVLSYSVARPSASAASYYAAATAPPTQELPRAYPPCCYYPHSSPYHGSLAPQTFVASPACDSYSDLFSDDNANSCIVM